MERPLNFIASGRLLAAVLFILIIVPTTFSPRGPDLAEETLGCTYTRISCGDVGDWAFVLRA